MLLLRRPLASCSSSAGAAAALRAARCCGPAAASASAISSSRAAAAPRLGVVLRPALLLLQHSQQQRRALSATSTSSNPIKAKITGSLLEARVSGVNHPVSPHARTPAHSLPCMPLSQTCVYTRNEQDKGSAVEVGMDVELEHTFGPEAVQTFAALSGDDNPIHLDAAFATKQVRGRRKRRGRDGWHEQRSWMDGAEWDT